MRVWGYMCTCVGVSRCHCIVHVQESVYYISVMQHACLTKGCELSVHVSVQGSLRLAPIRRGTLISSTRHGNLDPQLLVIVFGSLVYKQKVLWRKKSLQDPTTCLENRDHCVGIVSTCVLFPVHTLPLMEATQKTSNCRSLPRLYHTTCSGRMSVMPDRYRPTL